MLASVCNGVVFIAEYSGMTTAQSARAFFNTSQSAALAIGDIYEEGKRLTAWTELQEQHDQHFAYARALKSLWNRKVKHKELSQLGVAVQIFWPFCIRILGKINQRQASVTVEKYKEMLMKLPGRQLDIIGYVGGLVCRRLLRNSLFQAKPG
jgi:hypothetical protein